MQMQIIYESELKERLDKYLSQKTEFSRGQIQKLIEAEKILVNSTKVKQTYKLKSGDVIDIKQEKVDNTLKPIKHELEIVFENNDLLIINKPAYISVHPSSEAIHEETIVNWLLGNNIKLSSINSELRPGIVHRLDKDTSGLLIIAKNDQAHLKLNKLFSDRKIEKKYLAICFNEPESENGRIDAPISRDFQNRTKMTIENSSHARVAITDFKIIDKFMLEDQRLSVLECDLKTGRTHQIRVHLKAIGTPIVGDQKYGSKKLNERFFPNIKRQALHAYKLEFKWENELIKVEIPLAKELQSIKISE